MTLAFPKPVKVKKRKPSVVARRREKRVLALQEQKHYEKRKEEVRRLAGYQCENPLCECHYRSDDMRFKILEVMHIKPRSKGRIDDVDNLMLGCRYFHEKADFGDRSYLLGVLEVIKEKCPNRFRWDFGYEWLKNKLDRKVRV